MLVNFTEYIWTISYTRRSTDVTRASQKSELTFSGVLYDRAMNWPHNCSNNQLQKWLLETALLAWCKAQMGPHRDTVEVEEHRHTHTLSLGRTSRKGQPCVWSTTCCCHLAVRGPFFLWVLNYQQMINPGSIQRLCVCSTTDREACVGLREHTTQCFEMNERYSFSL